jgi:hypothetical protein
MGHMPSEDRPIDLDDPPSGEVVEFGGDAPVRDRRWSFSAFTRSLAVDHRVVPLTAALGAVAALASLVSEWQVTTVDPEVFGDGGSANPISSGITDVGALGTGYLVGLFPLVSVVVLTLFGPPAARRLVRLVGMSIAGTMLGLLFAIAAALGSESRPVPEIYTLQFDQKQIQFSYGRGLWCAVAGVLLAMLALYLAERLAPPPASAAEASSPAEDPSWAWRRPPSPREEPAPDQPLELTVGPTKPFNLLKDDRDEPNRS